MRTFVFTALTVFGLTACGDIESPDSDTARVAITLSAVPDDVQCLRITAAGPSRTVVREIEIMGGQSFSEILTGLPIGSVTFTGDAFVASCDSVTKSTIAGWASDPVMVSVALGRQASVALTMHRNGRVKVGVDFVDEVDASGGRADGGAIDGGAADSGT